MHHISPRDSHETARYCTSTAFNGHQNKTQDCPAEQLHVKKQMCSARNQTCMTYCCFGCNCLLFLGKSEILFQKARFSCLNCEIENLLPNTLLKQNSCSNCTEHIGHAFLISLSLSCHTSYTLVFSPKEMHMNKQPSHWNLAHMSKLARNDNFFLFYCSAFYITLTI